MTQTVTKERILISQRQIRRRTLKVAREIATDFSEKKVVVVGVLNGGAAFAIALLQALYAEGMDVPIDFVRMDSGYGEQNTQERPPSLIGKPKLSLEGSHILLTEDIIDSGDSLAALIRILIEEYRPASISIVALLSKDSKRNPNVDLREYEKYVLFRILDKWVYGFMIDDNEKGRGARHIMYKSEERQSGIARFITSIKLALQGRKLHGD